MNPELAGGEGAGQRAGVCPHFHSAVELIGKRWTGAILWTLLGQPMRFAELSQSIPGVSDRLLSERLKELEAEGIVSREVKSDSPVKVEYSLTKKGEELAPSISELRRWAVRWV
jgi:DNA-binding HxlR family transcriptional regulator